MKTIAAFIVAMAYIASIAAAGYGYIHNIVLLIAHTGGFGLMEVVRAVGILAVPLGAVMGYVA